MKQGKYAAPVRRRRRRNTLKPMLIAMAVVLLLGCVTGGTLAWLTDKTDAVVNTFTVGNIDITLKETWNHDSNGDQVKDSWQGKMIPGCTIAKDPKVTVKAGSEKCYLFVQVTKSDNFDSFMTYSMANGWALVEGQTNVYYRIVEPSTAAQAFDVLANNQVSVKDSVTKTMMDDITAGRATAPTLTFQAAAVQYFKNSDATDNAFTAAQALTQITWG